MVAPQRLASQKRHIVYSKREESVVNFKGFVGNVQNNGSEDRGDM